MKSWFCDQWSIGKMCLSYTTTENPGFMMLGYVLLTSANASKSSDRKPDTDMKTPMPMSREKRNSRTATMEVSNYAHKQRHGFSKTVLTATTSSMT